MRISSVKNNLCLVCVNRPLCLPKNEFPFLHLADEQFSHRDFLYFDKGSSLFKRGDLFDGIYCIYQGAVAITDKMDEHSTPLYATAGDYVGYNSIRNGRFINSAITTEDTFCCFLKTREVQQLLYDRRPVAPKIIDGF